MITALAINPSNTLPLPGSECTQAIHRRLEFHKEYCSILTFENYENSVRTMHECASEAKFLRELSVLFGGSFVYLYGIPIVMAYAQMIPYSPTLKIKITNFAIIYLSSS